MCPLKIYLYNEGLVRFGTDKYSLKSLDNKFAHLTNTSINKYAPNCNSKKGVIGPGWKWSFTQLRDYFNANNIDYDLLWFKIKMIVILTLIQFTTSAQNYEWCFELLGFDIFVDKKQKPWMLEVNTPPALGIDWATDENIKPKLIKDMIEILDFEKYDEYQKKMENEMVMKKQKQNYFFKKRFKSQRNHSVNPGSFSNNSNMKLSAKVNSRLHHANSIVKEASNSLYVKTPTAINGFIAPNKNGSIWENQSQNSELNPLFSSLSTVNKTWVKKISQFTAKGSASAGLRPAPYFKGSIRSLNSVNGNYKVSNFTISSRSSPLLVKRKSLFRNLQKIARSWKRKVPTSNTLNQMKISSWKESSAPSRNLQRRLTLS
jgi:hypothetical protein